MSDSGKAVFLSYASQDAAAARSICDSLREADIEVWFDQSELRGGDAWDQRIRHQIRDCALFVPIISTHTASRPEGYFRLEWDLADQRSHRVARNRTFIVPACIDNTPDSGGDVPESFLKVQWTRLPGGATPAAFCNHIAALLAPQELAAGPQAAAQTAAKPATAPRVPVARNPRRWIPVAIAAAVLLLTAIGWQAWRQRAPQVAGVASDAAPAAAGSGTGNAAAVAAPDKSIAVLPFVDMSEKHDQEYFSDGLSEELIDHLAHNPGLKVIARTSSFAFKGKNEDMRTIAAALGVAHLLEGSVRKAGTAMRITAQLIRASDGVHLWSQTYDRKLSDVFKVQDEIAATVASALNATLGAGPSAPTRPVSIEAHNLVLQGLFFSRRSTIEAMHAAEGYYLQALKIDPEYPAAWAELARAYSWDVQFGNSPAAEQSERARAAALTAIKFDPRSVESYTVLAMLASSYDFDWPAAEAALRQALTIDPHDADALRGAALIAWAHADLERTIRLLNEALEYDPLRAETRLNLGGVLYAVGRYPEAQASLHSAESIAPGELKVHFFLGLIAIKQGQRVEARTLFAAETGPWYRLAGEAILADVEGRRADADAALTVLARDYGDGSAAQLAEVYAQRGDLDSAFKWLERGYRMHDAGIRWLKADPLYAPLRHDPRYLPLLRKIRLPES
jgi:TolB-like protein/Tfp pilus assembly protein PilF